MILRAAAVFALGMPFALGTILDDDDIHAAVARSLERHQMIFGNVHARATNREVVQASAKRYLNVFAENATGAVGIPE